MVIKWTEQDVISRVSEAMKKVMQPQGDGQDTLTKLRQSVEAWKVKPPAKIG